MCFAASDMCVANIVSIRAYFCKALLKKSKLRFIDEQARSKLDYGTCAQNVVSIYSSRYELAYLLIKPLSFSVAKPSKSVSKTVLRYQYLSTFWIELRIYLVNIEFGSCLFVFEI